MIATPAMSDDADPLVEPLLFDTDAFPAGERFAAWCEHNRGSTFSRTDTGDFRARGKVWFLDGIVLSEHWTDAFDGHRDARMVRAVPLDHVMLIVPFAGTTRVRGKGVDVLCGPGQVAILDYRGTLATESSRQHGIAISIQRAVLEQRGGRVDAHGRLAASAEVDILIGYVRTLVDNLSAIRRSSLRTIGRILRDVIGMAVGVGTEPAPVPAAHADTCSRVIGHIGGMPLGSVTLARLLRDLPITRATLQRVFKADGGVIAYDRKRRLALIHRALCDGDRRTLIEIGSDCGFADPANLARLFRARYGYTMTQLRAAVAPIPAAAPANDRVVDLYRTTVASLSRA